MAAEEASTRRDVTAWVCCDAATFEPEDFAEPGLPAAPAAAVAARPAFDLAAVCAILLPILVVLRATGWLDATFLLPFATAAVEERPPAVVFVVLLAVAEAERPVDFVTARPDAVEAAALTPFTDAVRPDVPAVGFWASACSTCIPPASSNALTSTRDTHVKPPARAIVSSATTVNQCCKFYRLNHLIFNALSVQS